MPRPARCRRCRGRVLAGAHGSPIRGTEIERDAVDAVLLHRASRHVQRWPRVAARRTSVVAPGARRTPLRTRTAPRSERSTSNRPRAGASRHARWDRRRRTWLNWSATGQGPRPAGRRRRPQGGSRAAVRRPSLASARRRSPALRSDRADRGRGCRDRSRAARALPQLGQRSLVHFEQPQFGVTGRDERRRHAR